MEKNITLLKGDGIGPEIVNQAVKVLDAVAEKYGHKFNYTEVDIGGCSIDKFGVPITEEGMAKCKSADAVLLGAVGGPKWDNVDPSIRPEKALLAVRRELGLFANLRPTKLFPQLADSSPLKESIVGNGIDLMIVRELTGGIYFGARRTYEQDGVKVATDEMTYSVPEIEYLAKSRFLFILLNNVLFYVKRADYYLIDIIFNIAVFKYVKKLFVRGKRHLDSLGKTV